MCHSLRMPRLSDTRQRAAVTGWGVLLGLGVSFPILGSGFLLLLDWVTGSHTPLVPTQALGLNGGLTAGLPFTLAIDLLVELFGAAGTWLPLLVFFPLAAWGMSRLVGGSLIRQLAAATLYCVNPFVFQRVFVGHFGLLLGYALLPLATSSALRFFQSGKWWAPIPAFWWAVMTALSPHYAWIYGVVLVAVWIFHHPHILSVSMGGVAVCTAFAVLSAYLFLPHTATQLPSTHGTSELLDLYRTSGDSRLGLFPNVLGLYGFWRLGPGPQLPKDVFTGWPFVLLAILVVAGVGAAVQLRRRAEDHAVDTAPGQPCGRWDAGSILLIGTAGYFLALGDQGPTGPLFRWAYFHIPFFSIMEEPQKFLVLTALAYAVLFGWGVDHLARRARSPGSVEGPRSGWRTVGSLALAVVLPLAYTPTMFDGLAGQLTQSHYPASWEAADRLMGAGPGQVLFLPWHLYLSFPFTEGRVIADPAATSFRRTVISGDNIEAGPIETTSTSPRSAYLQGLFAQGRSLDDFGAQIAPLGVQYVVLAKTVDWRSYSWLDSQTDLAVVMASSTLEVWQNTAYSGVGAGTTPREVRQLSPVAYSIGPGSAGEITLDAVYQKGWMLGRQAATESPEGTIQFSVGPQGGVARFTPWGVTRSGYLISGVALVLMLGLVFCDRWWRARRSEQQPRVGRG